MFASGPGSHSAFRTASTAGERCESAKRMKIQLDAWCYESSTYRALNIIIRTVYRFALSFRSNTSICSQVAGNRFRGQLAGICLTKRISSGNARETGNRVTTNGTKRRRALEGFRIEIQEAYMKRYLRNLVLTTGLSVLLGSSTLSGIQPRWFRALTFSR
jgi:hypothetical protein